MRYWIRSIETTAGVFADAGKIVWKPGATVVIGPRGSFKSTTVQLVNACLGHDQARIAKLLTPNGWITSALGGGTVKIEVETPEGRVLVERTAAGVPKVTPKGATIPIEILSQGEVQEIALQHAPKLELLDRAHAARRDEIRKLRDERASSLVTTGQKLVPVLKQIQERRTLASAAPELRRKLDELVKGRPKKPKNLEEQQNAYNGRRGLYNRAKKADDASESILSDLRGLTELVRDFEPTAAELKKNGAPEAVALAKELEQRSREITKFASWADSQKSLTSVLEATRLAFEAQSKDYHALAAADQSRKQYLDKENELSAEIKGAEHAQLMLGSSEKEAAALRAERVRLRAEIRKLEEELHALRQKRRAELEEVTPLTVIKIEKRADRSAYDQALSNLMAGGSPKTRESVVASLDPEELIDIVEQNNFERIAKTGVRASDAVKFVETLARTGRLHAELENAFLDDMVEIYFEDEGVLKPIERLSEGQRATALLPLMLHGNTDAILIIDQPEDDLDNRFVCKTLVPLVKKLKSKRQVVLVTHNPNLVSLAEADQIVVMNKASADAAGAPLMGNFKLTKEDVIGLLEGGGVAFRERDRLYELPTLEKLREQEASPW